MQPEAGADGRGGDSVLAGAGFSDDAFFAEAFGEQSLPEGVVDFVSAGVEQVFAFEINFGSSEVAGQAFRKIKRGRTAHIVVKQIIEFRLE
jgi:hypothetical protein